MSGAESDTLFDKTSSTNTEASFAADVSVHAKEPKGYLNAGTPFSVSWVPKPECREGAGT